MRYARFIVAGRRLAVSVLAALAALVLVTACSSSTAGSGKSGGGGGGSTGSSAPSTGAGGGGNASGPAAGGGSSDFCTEWSAGGATGGLTGGQVGANFVAHWDKLAAIAPGAIKPDVQTVDEYLHSALSGHPDPSKASNIATAVSSIVQWVAQNCR